MLQNVFDRVLTGVTKRAAEVQAAASKQGQESLHTQAFANRAHAAGECKTRTAQKAHVEAAKVHAQRLIDNGGEQTEIMKRDVLGNLLTVVQDSQHPGDWAIRACLNYMNSQNSMTKGLALLTHAKLLDLMPPEKRSSELLAAVQTVATSLRSMDEIEVQYALKYISSCWDADLVPNIIGQPGQARKTGGSSSPENITLLSILLPDMSEARKPALSSPSTIKHTLAAFTSLVQRFGEQVETCISLLEVTSLVCQRHMSHTVLGLPTANLLRVVVSRCAANGQLTAASAAFVSPTVTALESARSCTPLPHYTMQALAAALSTLCIDSVTSQASNALGSAMDAAMAATGVSDDHEMASAYGTLSQCVIAVSKLPPGAPRVPDLQKKAIEVTRQMFNRAKSMKPSQWRNPNNLHFEALRCIVALQACKPSVATPFREEIVNCLRSSDASLRYLSADVLYNSCSADNLSSVAEQFLLIIRSSSEDSIRAAYSTKVAQLVETYAQPAEYARTMAAVLVAAGNAAPKGLASRIAGTLALCGEQTVQANTASVFSQLLKGQDPLSDAQLLVAFWVVAEYGEFANVSAVENVKSIVRVSVRQRLSQEQEAAALAAVFKIAAKAGASAAALQAPLAGFLKAREASRDIMVARLASFTASAIRQPGTFTKVVTPADQVSTINQDCDIDVSSLAGLAAEQRAQGQANYATPDERFGLFTSSISTPVQPSLRTEQYATPGASPSLSGAGTSATAASPSPEALPNMATGATPSPQQGRASRPPPRAKTSRGTFSNMMMGPSDPPPQLAAATAAGAVGGMPVVSAASHATHAAPARDTFASSSQNDSLADMLFGGSSGGATGASRPQPSAVVVTTPAPAPAPLTDLLGDFGAESAAAATSAVNSASAAGGGSLEDLLGGGSVPAPTASPEDPLAALSGLSMRDTKPTGADGSAAASSDPFADFTSVSAAPAPCSGHAVDLASDLDMLSDPMPVVSASGVTSAQSQPVDPQWSLLGTGPPESDPVASSYAVPPPLPVGPVPYRQNEGVPGWPGAPDGVGSGSGRAGEFDSAAGTGAPQEAAKSQGKLTASAPKKKGDAFADLLAM